MPRKFPRFLFSDPKDTKSKGPFVIHTLFPKFICRVIADVDEMSGSDSYYIHHSGWTLELLQVLEDEVNDPMKVKVSDCMYQILNWLAQHSD